MDRRIKINVNLLTLDRLFGGDLGVYADKARAMEDAGIDGIVMPDHVVFGKDVTYPWGGWAVDPTESWPEPMTVLAMAAGATKRLDLITNVLIAPLRSPVLLAKQAATLYGLSNGRFQLGAGTGWQRHEYEASGQLFAGRSDFLFDQMRACRELWHEWPASFSSPHFSFKDIWCSPRLPVTSPAAQLDVSLHRPAAAAQALRNPLRAPAPSMKSQHHPNVIRFDHPLTPRVSLSRSGPVSWKFVHQLLLPEGSVFVSP